ncbi:MAG: ABC transporter permease [Clostridiales bacterium]|nr:ABC transporter permease [Clostridiales bacterium]
MIRNKKLYIGLFIVLFITLLALIAPYISTFHPAENDLVHRLMPPNQVHFLGTDHLGRDVFSRLVYGARLSIGISLFVLIISLVIGTLLGILAGYYGGIVDDIIMTITEILLAFPSMILSLAIVGIMGAGIKNTIIAVSVFSWIGYTKLVRGMVMSFIQKDFVKSARICGSSDFKIMFIHILPNIFNNIIVYSVTSISTVMMQISSLSFLGLGVQPPIAEWGNMLNEAKGYITNAPWLIIAPSAALVLMIMGFNLLGDGVAEYLNNKKNGSV